MPATYTVDAGRRVLFMRCWGVLVEDDLLTMSSIALRDPRVGDRFDRLIDLTEVTKIAITSDGLRSIAEIARKLPVGKRALVAPDPLIFGLARMFEQNLQLGESARVFRDMPDALAFLGLERDTPWPE